MPNEEVAELEELDRVGEIAGAEPREDELTRDVADWNAVGLELDPAEALLAPPPAVDETLMD